MMKIISRKDALALGLKRYFTGKPCKRGHISERRVLVNGSCGGQRCLKCRREHELGFRATPLGKAARHKERHGIAMDQIPPPRVAGHCDLCSRATKKLCWDHDHTLEELGFPMVECHRGWLCFHCNTSLGKLGDTAQGLAKALAYVSYKPKSNPATSPGLNTEGTASYG